MDFTPWAIMHQARSASLRQWHTVRAWLSALSVPRWVIAVSLLVLAGRPTAALAADAAPATFAEAVDVLDLRKLPLVDGAQGAAIRTLGILLYTAPGDPKQAYEFHKRQLAERGFKERPGGHRDENTVTGEFTKQGYTVALSTFRDSSGTAEAPRMQATLVNHGNVDLTKLPRPADAKEFYARAGEASYLTRSTVAETAAAAAKLLEAAGWSPYGTASDDPDSPMLHFKRNSMRIQAWVSTAPAQNNQTLLRYSAELLQSDLPLPPLARDARYDDTQATLRFDCAPDEIAAVYDHYRQSLQPAGWKPTTDEAVTDAEKRTEFMVFRNPAGDLISVDLLTYNDVVNVKAQFYTAEEVQRMDELAKQQAVRQREEMARARQPVETPLSLPGVAEKVTQKDDSHLVFELPSGTGPAGLRQLRAQLAEAGWQCDDEDPTDKTIGHIRMTKGTAALSLSYWNSSFGGAEITVEGSEFVVLKTDAAKSPPAKVAKQPKPKRKRNLADLPGVPKLPAGVTLPDLPEEVGEMLDQLETDLAETDDKKAQQPTARTAARPNKSKDVPAPPSEADDEPANAPEQAEKPAEGPRLVARAIPAAQQKQTAANLWVGAKQHKLAYGVAYETLRDGERHLEVLLSVKPISGEKLAELYNSGGDAGDAVGFDPHLKLRFDPAGKLGYLFFYAEGLSINRGNPGDDSMAAEMSLAEGRVRGKAVMAQPEKIFDDEFRFDAAFDAPLATREVAGDDPSVAAAAEAELGAEEHDGLPYPLLARNRSSSGSKFRKTVNVTVPAPLAKTVAFYRRELAARGWREDADAAKLGDDTGSLRFTAAEGTIAAEFRRDAEDTLVDLDVRYPQRVQSAGLMPPPNKGCLVLGNASDAATTLSINGQSYKLPAGHGAEDPKQGTLLHLLPGKYTLKCTLPGQQESVEEIVVQVGQTWGAIVAPTGAVFVDRLY